MNLDDAIADLARARKRLEAGQGRLARKNARAAVKAVLATAQRMMDRDYPLVRKERVVKVSMSPVAKKRRERRARLRLVTTTSVVTDREAAILATLGVKLTTETYVTTEEGRKQTDIRVPAWAVKALRAGVGHATIGMAASAPHLRRRLEASMRLQNGKAA